MGSFKRNLPFGLGNIKAAPPMQVTHNIKVEVEQAEITQFGSTQRRFIAAGCTVKCDCGFRVECMDRTEAGQAAQQHAWSVSQVNPSGGAVYGAVPASAPPPVPMPEPVVTPEEVDGLRRRHAKLEELLRPES